MLCFINPGHDQKYDSGAVNPGTGARECDIAARIGEKLREYLKAAGVSCIVMQSDNLDWDTVYSDRMGASVCGSANDSGADLFVSIHCNAANGAAKGTETLIYSAGGKSQLLAQFIQDQIVNSLDMVDRGLKERPELIVLHATDMPAVLVETGFIDNDEDFDKLANRTDEFAAAIARGVTDYEQAVEG